ncbi:MAG: hypothetical protein AAGF47_08945 [Planctomycetota bacterium]
MLLRINTVQRLVASSRWVLGLVLTCAAAGAIAQAPNRITAPTQVEAVRAFERLQPWVRGFAVPDDAAADEFAGACVTLHWRGRVIGRGEAIGLGTATLPDATRLALDEARAALMPLPRPDADEALALRAGEIAISLELAGTPVPVEVGTYSELTATLSPGIDAIAVRIGDAGDVVFPLEMLRTRQQAGSAASRLVGALTGDAMLGLRQPAELAPAGVGFFRLATVAVAQQTPGGAAVPLLRGGRLVLLADTDARAIRDQARSTLGWLLRHAETGVYLPSNDSVLREADATQQAMVAFAIARAVGSPHRARWPSDDARPVAIHIVQGLADRASLPPAAAALGFAASELLGRPDLGASLREHLLIGVPDDRQRAIAAWGMAVAGESERARELIAELRSVEHAGQLIVHMPWLGWTEQILAGDGAIPNAVGLREMRRLIAGFQLTPADAGPENADLVGGIVFTSGPVPLPTWQSARPAAFLASMLRDPRLTEPTEVGDRLVDHAGLVRFLMQLAATQTEGHLYRDPASAAGGIRAATWDHSMPIEASALTLITLLETLDSLAELQADPPGPAD